MQQQPRKSYHDNQQQIPQQFLCPISQRIMIDPVLTKDAISFQRSQLVKWIQKQHKDPFSRQSLQVQDLKPNRALRDAIQSYLKNIPKLKRQRLELNQMRNLLIAIEIRQKDIQQIGYSTQMGNDEKKQFQLQIKQIKQENQLLKNKLIEKNRYNKEIQNKLNHLIQINQMRNQKFQFYKKLFQQIKSAYDNIKQKKCNCILINKMHQQFQNKIKLVQNADLKLKNDYNYEKQLQDKEEFQKLPKNLQSLLKGAKRIKLTPNKSNNDFQYGRLKLNKNDKISNLSQNICIGYGTIVSNQSLPIKEDQQSFYFIMNVIQMKHNNLIQIGFTFFNEKQQTVMKTNSVTYDLFNKKLDIFNRIVMEKPLVSNELNDFPCNMIVFVNKNKNDRHIYWIWNNEIQIKIPLEQEIINKGGNCYAVLRPSVLSSKEKNKIQFL